MNHEGSPEVPREASEEFVETKLEGLRLLTLDVLQKKLKQSEELMAITTNNLHRLGHESEVRHLRKVIQEKEAES